MAKRPLHRVSRYVGMAAIAATVAAATVACGSDDSSAGSGYTGTVGKVDLSKVCPAKIVVQTDWAPESEHGHLYQLLGPDAKIDAGAKKVVGPLFTGGEYTGVDIEIRAGGPAIGNQSVVSTMYQDPSIMLGYVDTDQAVQTSKQFPTTAVMASVDISPQMIMWDPATYPQVTKIADLKATGASVLYFQGTTWMDYVTGAGILSPSQVDGSYDGTPANFVAAKGKKAQQGYASSEPQLYEEEIEGWKKPVKYQLVNDIGFPTYKSSVALRTPDVEKYSDCLKQFVPVMQKGVVDFFADPAPANKVILDAVKQYDTGWVYTQRNADYAVETMKKLKLVGNSAMGAVGGFDEKRVQRIIDITTPIFAKQNSPAADGLTPEKIATNEFIDKSVVMP
ncbi:ABC transporter substrate-binding protein [Gordonia sp. (in: high G+C Gram-positive bacteria)]|uniref:ABC transporter substrate-binding protein n=1 Tax=Gordonia sp. (in: high G+C Gram-positive bacteria) TaxID=84139 RepID=UPI001DF74CB2|nr:ABC transporter substrate-binding protein [Gordonia sp. (in: high G+C Gram-positive bacteria)]MCB1294544.1 ABC transporter substrate-binding protein [Gordonia sp. (in: high G+C Gram-positive bacteria)]HMS75440.1 ABC transporter substrate-binding protein [Gordonia sp. (in: high G+C Gram-positive bacteria)]HQV19417.1 ABC transporter substrate-binding protein [Gordonia sp. (in: high G+C Gram-positive bacteria)]